MKRLTAGLLTIALASWGPACTSTTGTAPDPVPAGPSGPPVRWTGTASFTEDVQSITGSSKNRFEIEVTWVKAENPSPAPPAGTTRYVPSGRVHVFMQSYTDAGRCEVDRDGEFPIEVTVAPRLPDEQSLDLGPDGRYQGKLYGSWSLDYLQYCRSLDVTFQNRATLYLSLDIQGALEGSRMQGNMPPRVLTIPTLTSTRTGSWSFASN